MIITKNLLDHERRSLYYHIINDTEEYKSYEESYKYLVDYLKKLINKYIINENLKRLLDAGCFRFCRTINSIYIYYDTLGLALKDPFGYKFDESFTIGISTSLYIDFSEDDKNDCVFPFFTLEDLLKKCTENEIDTLKELYLNHLNKSSIYNNYQKSSKYSWVESYFPGIHTWKDVYDINVNWYNYLCEIYPKVVNDYRLKEAQKEEDNIEEIILSINEILGI